MILLSPFALLAMTSISVLSFIVARRSTTLQPLSLASWRAYSWPRILCLTVFVTSYVVPLPA
jgi:hypothetical protein